jgi:hypothetical protein
MWNRMVYIFMVASVLGACKSKKVLVTATSVPVDSALVNADSSSFEDIKALKQAKIEAVEGKRSSFSTVSGKAKAALKIGTNSNDVTMNIRIKDNQAIWVSVTALAGLEVARALITPDSVKVINRLENEYIQKPFSYLHEFTNENINFGTLQSVFLGNPISEFLTESTEIDRTDAQESLKSAVGSMLYRLVINEQNKVIRANLDDESEGRSLAIAYDDFQTVSGQQVPHSIVMKSQVKAKNISLDLKFTKIEFDVPVDIPFRVPDRFTIKN